MKSKILVIALALAGLSVRAAEAAYYRYQVPLTVSGYAGSTTLSGFPVLVRLSDTAIDGFYSKLSFPATGRDIRFTDLDGNELPHEIDTWDATGTSLVWVKVPSLAGTATTIRMAFGSDDPPAAATSSAGVWTGGADGFYAGVWHFGESITSEQAAGRASSADSAKHDPALVMDAIPSDDSKRVSEMVSSNDCVIGRGRVCQSTYENWGNALVVSNYDGFALGNTFTISGWFYMDEAPSGSNRRTYQKYFHRSGFTSDTDGWSLFDYASLGNTVGFLGGGNWYVQFDANQHVDKWIHLVFVVDGANARVFYNGSPARRYGKSVCDLPLTSEITDNGRMLEIGGQANGADSLSGRLDEMRLHSEALSADWIQAEYDTATKADFVTPGALEALYDACTVTAEPEELGEPDPAYGVLTGLSDGETIHFTAPSATISGGDDLRYRFTGWSFYALTADKTYELLDSQESLSYDYQHARGNTMRKMVWNLVRQRPLTASVSPQGGGTIVVGGVTLATDGSKNWIDENAAATIRAVPAEGWRFLYWLPGPVAHPTEAETTVSTLAAGEVSAVFFYEGTAGEPKEVTWQASGTGLWSDAANWDRGVPQRGDTVLLTNASARIILDAPTPTLGSLVVGDAANANATTLVVSNWFSQIAATTVTVAPKGRIVLEGLMTDGGPSNRIWIAAQDLTVAADGEICADSAGYAAFNGPAWEGVTPAMGNGGIYAGSYGGEQGWRLRVTKTPHTYGSAEWPFQSGSGGGVSTASAGGANQSGGGAIYLQLTGALRVDGTVSADGFKVSSYWNYAGTGSGGGIAISCRTISGTGSIRASARPRTCQTDVFGAYLGGAGGGGRVAVHYDPTAQGAVDCAIRFDVSGTDMGRGKTSLGQLENRALGLSDAGTLWLPDSQLLTSSAFVAAGWPFSARLVCGEPLGEIVVNGDLTVDGSHPEFDDPNLRLTITGNLTVRGDQSHLYGFFLDDFTSCTVGGNLTVEAASFQTLGGFLHVKGDAELRMPSGETELRKGGVLQAMADPTNAPGTVGATVRIDGTWRIATNAACVVVCDQTNGAIVAMSARKLELDAGGRITADGAGWDDNLGPGVGHGYAYYYTTFASHGGLGAHESSYAAYQDPKYGSKPPYDSRENPCEPGSGAYTTYESYHYCNGGGVVMLTVDRTARLNGIVSADAFSERGGAGGTVNLKIRRLMPSTGVVRADGSLVVRDAWSYLPKGGGGRVAIRTGNNPSASTLTVTAAHAEDESKYTQATDGTVYWGKIAPLGAVLYLK